MDGIFDSQIALLQKSLDLRVQRHNVLAGNIANVETPKYKARDLVFEGALAEALQARQPGLLRVTNPRHLDGRHAMPLALVQPRIIHTGNPTGSLDGNSVDLEREMAKLAENQIAYQFLARMLNSKFQSLRETIREGEP